MLEQREVKNIKKRMKVVLSIFLLTTISLLFYYITPILFAWSGPSEPPPGGNLDLMGIVRNRFSMVEESVLGNVEIDLSEGSVFKHTLTGDVTYTGITGFSLGKQNSFRLIIKQNSSTLHAITWSTNIFWKNNEIPSPIPLSSEAVYDFITHDDGVTWYGSVFYEDRNVFSFPGNVGIGTTNPGAKLDVIGSVKLQSTSYADVNVHRDGTGWSNIHYSNNTGMLGRMGFTGIGDFVVRTGSSDIQRMNILASSGHVGIGTISPVTPLHVGTKSFSDGRYYSGSIVIENNIPSLTLVDNDGTTWLDHNNDNRRSWWYWVSNTWAQRMYLTTDGNLWIGGSLSQGSDRRMKTDINDLRYGMDEIMQIIPREFTMIENRERKIGFIAQEIEKIIPEVVLEDETGGNLKSVSYSELTALIVKGMQEQQQIIEDQQKQINELRELIESL